MKFGLTAVVLATVLTRILTVRLATILAIHLARILTVILAIRLATVLPLYGHFGKFIQ